MVPEMQADKQVSKAIILAQCDNWISNILLKKKGLQIMSMVEDVDYDYISNWIVTDNRYKKCDETLKRFYNEALGAGYIFEHDAFGGYGLFYNCDVPIVVSMRRDVFLHNLCALLQPVSGSDMPLFEPISIFSGTEAFRQNRIMVGPVRFANHSYCPNAEYVAFSFKTFKSVKLKLLKKLSNGEEITVFYGSSFFGEGNWECNCPHSSMHCERPMIFSEKQRSLISANIEKCFVRLSNQKRRKPLQKKVLSYEMRFFVEWFECSRKPYLHAPELSRNVVG